MKNLVNFIIVAVFVSVLSACSDSFTSNVSRFHELPPPQGETVLIVPKNPANNASLEFSSYANIVGGYLAKWGYKPAGKGRADLIAELDYGVDNGKVTVRDYSIGNSYGYYGHYYPYGYYDYYDPFFSYGYPRAVGIREDISYTRRMSLTIRPNKAGAKNLFEGTVESVGRNDNLTAVMPLMIQALFVHFPGTSGTTEKVVIKLANK